MPRRASQKSRAEKEISGSKSGMGCNGKGRNQGQGEQDKYQGFLRKGGE